MNTITKMVQYSVWPNCNNNCDFCLRLNRKTYSTTEQIHLLKQIQKNIKYIDWKEEFSSGISLLGGEIYNIIDKRVQQEFMQLIRTIIDNVLLTSQNTTCKYSTVTNGIYDPAFLYRVIDEIVSATDIKHIDINFSYDLKYRYKTDAARTLVLKNINEFHDRYDYNVGVQMILTQHVIDCWKSGQFDVNTFIDTCIPGNTLCFLYPHPVNSGKVLTDFMFKRSDFLKFIVYLKRESPRVYESFVSSCKNSSVFKYTGYINRNENVFKDFFLSMFSEKFSIRQQPVLSDGKEIENPVCGHSVLYKCYADSDRCVLCDLTSIEDGSF